MSMEFVRPAPPPKQPLYFVHPVVDWGIIGGLSILFFLVLQGLMHAGSPELKNSINIRDSWAWGPAAMLSWVINWPHFSATNYRLYNSKQNMSQYPFTAFVIPFLVLAGTLASFAQPVIVAPFFAKLFLIWSPYHFSGQSVGISMIYARRAGFQPGKLGRLGLAGFIFGTFVYSTARSEVGLGDFDYYGITVPFLGLPRVFSILGYPVELLDILGWGLAAFGALFLFVVVRWCVTNRRILPPVVLLPAAAQFIWFVPGGLIGNFNEFVPMFHSLQYMLIAWSMQLKERVDEHAIVPTRRFAFLESSRWFLINVAGGAILFYYLPKLAASAGSPPMFAEGVILSAIQIHHFFVDGVIWKLKNPKVSSPLLVNIPDLIRGEPRPARAIA